MRSSDRGRRVVERQAEIVKICSCYACEDFPSTAVCQCSLRLPLQGSIGEATSFGISGEGSIDGGSSIWRVEPLGWPICPPRPVLTVSCCRDRPTCGGLLKETIARPGTRMGLTVGTPFILHSATRVLPLTTRICSWGTDDLALGSLSDCGAYTVVKYPSNTSPHLLSCPSLQSLLAVIHVETWRKHFTLGYQNGKSASLPDSYGLRYSAGGNLP